MVILKSDLFCSWRKVVQLYDGNATLVIFKDFEKNSGSGGYMSKINDIYFIICIKGITLRIAWLNMIYYASILIKAIYTYNLLHHNTGHPAYVITYTECDMSFYALLESS